MTTIEVISLSAKKRADLAKRLCSPINRYPKPRSCACGETELKIWHQFGAMVICPTCGKCGRFVSGSDYQAEEEHAIIAWGRR